VTPAGNRGAPLSAALALLAAITLSTAVWAGVAVPRTAAVVREAVTQEDVTTATAGELLGDDGRYTILFLGSDKRCRRLGSPLGAERCSSLESKVSAASVEGAAARDLYPYIWSNVADVALDQARNRAGTERTDTMTLLTVDPATGEAAALSIPRDMERFPLKPSLARDFCRPGSTRFNTKVNALYVYAQLCMKATPALRAWERSSRAAEKVRENLAYAFNIEIDDWVLATFGGADVLGAALDRLAPAPTLVHLDDKSRFAACRTNRLRTGNEMSYIDRNLRSNAKYGDLLFLRPGSADRFGVRSAWAYANCREPESNAVRTTSPFFIPDSCPVTGRSAEGCIFDVPSNLWTGFARARKYDGDTNRIRRAQRILSAITVRVIDAGAEVATQLATLAAMRWYAWADRNAAGVVRDWNLGPALVRGSIRPDDVSEIFGYVATARAQLVAGPDDPAGWRPMLLLGQRVTLPSGASCRVAGASLFGGDNFSGRLACTRAWVGAAFGPVTAAP
jgi:anionic cell wall polymer biosynthesis LytR-Cps2A-Psr (LCP) family protein